MGVLISSQGPHEKQFCRFGPTADIDGQYDRTSKERHHAAEQKADAEKANVHDRVSSFLLPYPLV